ncbi:MAG: hypothetical protein AAFX78_05065 [Cyanobacteria bacterium J06638_20]
MSLTTYARTTIANSVWGGDTFTPPTNWHVIPVTAVADADAGSVTEASGVSRVSVANNSTSFPNASGTTTVTKTTGIEVETTNLGSTQTVVGIAIFDAATGGNCWVVIELSASVEITSGNPYTIPIGGITITSNPGSPHQNLTTFAIARILDSAFGGAALNPPTTYHFAVLTAISDAAAGTGTQATGVARVGYANNDTTFPDATGTATVVKTTGIDFQTAAFGTTQTIVGVALWDSGSGGNCWAMRSLNTPRQVQAGNPFKIAAGDLDWNQTVAA